nr:sensor histidine kinase [Kovacikia minuta]
MFFTSLGFGLSWLAVLLSQQKEDFFFLPLMLPLLLVVVIRACLVFPWRGRILVALFAYGSFLLMLISAVQRFRRIRVPLDRLPPINQTSSAFSQHLVTSLVLNAALLFGLVLVFVLLLVGSLLAERQSHQELVLANAHLRQYALAIEDQAILQERNRIAREIHDSLGHLLTAQSIQLENVSTLLLKNTEQADHYLQSARRLGKEALQSVRQSVGALRSRTLREQSLAIALTQLLQEFEKTTGIQIKTQITLVSSPREEVTTALYRITQEALTNSSKHSDATQMQLQLTERKLEICLRIEDNGRGFDPEVNTTGFGLQGMRERAEVLGGTLCLNSQVGKGCQIEVKIPLSGRKG